jgi:hypothetical protein
MKYVLKTERGTEILNLCNKLLKNKLLKSDRDLVLLTKTQLEPDWRKPLLMKLNKIVNKYNK